MRPENFFSLRVIGRALLCGVVVGALAGAAWKPLGVPVFLAVALLAYVGFATSMVLYCPYCAKRVKMGAVACHHCGRRVVE